MTIKTYDYLTEDSKMIRQKVFMEEQGFQNEYDEIDEYATHVVMYEEGQPIANCRFYKDSKRDLYIIGRIAVLKTWRGKSVGARLLKEAECEIKKSGGTLAGLAAQIRASEFYSKQGYIKEGEPFFDEYCPHIWMYKIL